MLVVNFLYSSLLSLQTIILFNISNWKICKDVSNYFTFEFIISVQKKKLFRNEKFIISIINLNQLIYLIRIVESIFYLSALHQSLSHCRLQQSRIFRRIQQVNDILKDDVVSGVVLRIDQKTFYGWFIIKIINSDEAVKKESRKIQQTPTFSSNFFWTFWRIWVRLTCAHHTSKIKNIYH
jgi:hypothetical protein